MSTFAAKSTQNLNVNVSVSHGSTVHSFTTVTNNNKNMLQRQQVGILSISLKLQNIIILILLYTGNKKHSLGKIILIIFTATLVSQFYLLSKTYFPCFTFLTVGTKKFFPRNSLGDQNQESYLPLMLVLIQYTNSL